MNKLNLKETFDFIHNILETQSQDWDKIDDCTISHDYEEVVEAYHYYADDELKEHTCTLTLLADKIEFEQWNGQADSFIVLRTETE